MTAQEYVKSIYPQAHAFGPINTYWPGQEVQKGRFLVSKSPISSMSEGGGDSIESAWEDAAKRIHVKQFLKKGLTSADDYEWAKKELIRLPSAEMEPGKEKAIEQLTAAIKVWERKDDYTDRTV